MKIAFVTRNYPPDTLWGGDAVYYHNLARTLAARGHEIHVICQAVNKPKDYKEDGVFVYRVGTNPRQYSAIARINYSLHAWFKLRSIIKKYKVEIVEVPDWSAEGFLYSFRKRTPLVITALGSTDDPIWTRNYSGIKQLISLKVLFYLAKWTTKRADKIIAISKDSYVNAIRRYHIDHRKVVMVPLGIDIKKFQFTESNIRSKLGIPNNVHVILFVGRLEIRNGIHILCQAIPKVVKRVPNVKFILVGRDTNTAPVGGSFKSYIIKKSNFHGFQNNILLLDFLPNEELVSLYSGSDVVVYPALTSTFGLPVIEAMICGKPVVATHVGIVPELKRYGLKGLKVVPISDSEKLAEAIIDLLLLKDEDKRYIAKENREIVESIFSAYKWVDNIVKIYATLLT
jgi:glycosyltransferase involved in cell wall biosynthesis